MHTHHYRDTWILVDMFAPEHSRVAFFFQAEDGIRGRNVTGVQTCALPIWGFSTACGSISDSDRPAGGAGSRPCRNPRCHNAGSRSEERRVGKECRSRWSGSKRKTQGEKAKRDACKS